MEIKQIVSFRSYEINLFFTIRVGNKRDLFSAAMRKIAILYNLSKQRHVYALLKLVEIKTLLDKALHDITPQAKYTKKILKKRVNIKSNLLTPVFLKKQLGFSFPLAFQFIDFLKKFDECFIALYLAYKSGGFVNANDYYRIKKRLIKNSVKAVSSIVRIDVWDIPIVTIEQFLDNSHRYQVAEEKHGAVHPQIFYNALHSESTPNFSEEYLKNVAMKLREKVSGSKKIINDSKVSPI